MESYNSWVKRARCRNENEPSDTFFPNKSIAKGRRFCSECPVKVQCKTYAIVHDEYGIWGGTTRFERERLDPETVEALREMYQSHGLLENRQFLSLLQGRCSGSQSGDTYPNAHEQVC
jgi:hypothetical protein